MSWSLDAWFPNFTLFVVYLAPALLLIIFATLIFSRIFRWDLTPNKLPTKHRTMAEMLGYFPLVYIFFPIWDIAEYVFGQRSSILDRLFTFHFPNMMFIIVLVGIGQVLYYMLYPVRGSTGENS